MSQDRKRVLVCIQYELVQKKTEFEAFKSLCKNLGDDVISYSDFDYWYHRFVQGELDLNHVRNKDEPTLELTEMPIEITQKILEKLCWSDRVIMRHVSRKFRDVIDELPKKVFHKIKFYIGNNDGAYLKIDKKLFHYFTADFTLEASGKDTIKIFGGFQQAFDKLSEIISPRGAFIDKFKLEINSKKKKIRKLIRVKTLKMTISQEPLMVAMMQYFEPGILKTINLSYDGDDESEDEVLNVKDIIETKQWKMAKYVKMNRVRCPPKALSDFNRFEIEGIKMDYGSLSAIKDAISTSSNFEYGCLKYRDDIDEDKLREKISCKNVLKASTGETFFIECRRHEVIFKNAPLLEKLSLIVHGDRSAQLKMDGKIVDYSLDVVNETDRQKTGNWKVAIDDMFTVFRKPTLEIRQLTVELHQLGVCNKNVMETIEKQFKSLNHKISVNSFIMSMETEEQLMALLPYIEPKTIKSLEINGREDSGEWIEICEVVKMNQWKCAEKLQTKFVEVPWQSLLHFQFCKVMCKKVDEKALLAFKSDIVIEGMVIRVLLHFQEAFDVQKIQGLLGVEPVINDSQRTTVEVGTKTIELTQSNDEN